MKQLKIYVAGPMRRFWEEQYNAARFALAAAKLRGLGFDVITPIELDIAAGVELDRHPDEFTPMEIHFMLMRDYAALSECDAVATFQMGVESDGRASELAHAACLRIPVFEIDTEEGLAALLAWREGRNAKVA